MTTKELVLEWLYKHQGFKQGEVSNEDFAHFVNILTDCAEFVIRYKTRNNELRKNS